ncbi:energy transducer TonB [Aestuariivivens insulae]|uniref:energy transducer TonB n=1 Tax=Aestuariivivens insulae TaxID=1621988 RepID=UPI001F5AB728|nr:energy transducer TonB [Aestuariivivens insulae]
MRNPKDSHDLIRQNEEYVRKPQKHDANLQKNSTLYFQIGLIVCLLFTHGLFEMEFETTIHSYTDLPQLEEPDYIESPQVKLEKPVFEEPIQRRATKDPKYKEVPDDTPDPPFIDKPKETLPDNPVFDPDALPDLPDEPEDNPVPFAFIEVVPIYPGCEGKKTNDAKRKCMSEKISKLVRRKFNGDDVASDYGLQGIQKIDVQFTIDKTGNVNNIKTRAPHPKLEDEAVRVINLIPEMTPGKQNDKNVGVIYNLPIVFKVQ